MPQNGSRVIWKDSEVPSVSEEHIGTRLRREIPLLRFAVTQLERAGKLYGLLTLKRVLTFLWGNHCRVY